MALLPRAINRLPRMRSMRSRSGVHLKKILKREMRPGRPNSRPFSSVAQADMKGSGSLKKFLVATGLTGGIGALYYMKRKIEEVQIIPELIQMEEPKEYIHPFENASWYYKAYVRTKRTVYLAFIFTPCALLYGFATYTKSDEWREYWLQMLVSTLELSGCSMQKFAQWCSMRPDMFSQDLIEALGKLRTEAPEHSYEHTRQAIKESFGREIEEIFEFFDEKPVASGTVAQVHHARLKPEHAIDGKIRDVAVKVQHPNVLEETFCDVDLLWKLIEMDDKLTFPMKKDDFVDVLQRQTNFEWEAYNLTKFANNFRKEIASGKVKFPNVSLDLLSPSVLIESWADGGTVDRFFASVEEGINEVEQAARKLSKTMSTAIDSRKRELANTLFAMNMKMFLRDNYIHSDLHAGNILFSEKTGNVTVLDAGQTATLLPDVAPQFGAFLHSICTHNKKGVYDNLLEFDEKKGSGIKDVKAFREDVNKVMDKHCAPGEAVIVGDVMGQLLFVLSDHDVILRSDVSVSLMSMAVSEGLIRSLDPEFDLVKAAMPYIAKYGTFDRLGAD